MTKLDKERRLVVDRVKKFEQTTREIHDMADKLHNKMEQLHVETIATRTRGRPARKNAAGKSNGPETHSLGKQRKVS